MRVGFPGGPRLEWYDRNPISRVQSVELINIPPHGGTTRASYTVPTGKKAWIEIVSTWTRRTVAAGAVGLAGIRFSINAAGVNGRFVMHYFVNNNVDYMEDRRVTVLGALQAGDNYDLLTEDGSTGGAVSYTAAIKRTEFDA